MPEFEVVVERPNVVHGSTIHDVVELIGKVEDPDHRYKIIKRLIHSEKSSVYRKCQSDYANDEFIEMKVETHRKLYRELDRELEPILKEIF